MKGYTVEPISYQEAKPWILKKHYAHRMPAIQHSFGLHENRLCCGIVAYGMPANANNSRMGEYPMWELVRLVVETKKKNAASFLVGGSLKMLPPPCACISYADETLGHVGYIYQATNWIYTGISKGDTEWTVDGKKYHRKNVYNFS